MITSPPCSSSVVLSLTDDNLKCWYVPGEVKMVKSENRLYGVSIMLDGKAE